MIRYLFFSNSPISLLCTHSHFLTDLLDYSKSDDAVKTKKVVEEKGVSLPRPVVPFRSRARVSIFRFLLRLTDNTTYNHSRVVRSQFTTHDKTALWSPSLDFRKLAEVEFPLRVVSHPVGFLSQKKWLWKRRSVWCVWRNGGIELPTPIRHPTVGGVWDGPIRWPIRSVWTHPMTHGQGFCDCFGYLLIFRKQGLLRMEKVSNLDLWHSLTNSVLPQYDKNCMFIVPNFNND